MYVHMHTHTHTHTHNVATNDLYQKIVQKSITINTVVARCVVEIKLANEKFTIFYTLLLSINSGLPHATSAPTVSANKPTVFLDLRPSSDDALGSAGQGSAKLEGTKEE